MNIAVIELATSIAVFQHADGCCDQDKSSRRQALVGAKTPKCEEWHAKLRFSRCLSRTRQKT
jgi:hypothetical protein